MSSDAAIIRDAFVSRRTLPRNLRTGDRALFAHELERTIAPMALRELTNVSVNPDGMLFKGGRALPETFAWAATYEDFRNDTRRRIGFFARNYLLRRRRRLPGRFLFITDEWSPGYFHWLADVLPRLFALRDLAAETVLLLPAAYKDLEYAQACLALFALAGIEYLPRDSGSVVDQLVLPLHAVTPSGNFDDPLLRDLRDFLLGAYGIERQGRASRRIYISRARAAKRRIANEEEVLGVLRAHDFEIVHFEDHPFEQQVRIAAETRYLVSNHGAGLTNMLFMPEGGHVLELRRENECERNCFFSLATTANLGYYYQSCRQEDPADRGHTANIVVDTRALRENLELLLNSVTPASG